ncbi:MAG: EI24 domain-containing protein [Chitinophagaceae bacterium]|nr:EI24 domain-containing protein [Chitinophagaceae bacterium]OQY96292.1 MAG: hypothetical protein B6D37_02035 [Sphingobacteriales bacterium UTBCD1]
MLKEIVIAIQSFSEVNHFIRQHKLWKWIIIPGIVYALLFIVSMYFFGKSATHVIEYLTTTTGLGERLQKFQSSWAGFLFTFAGIILWLLLLQFYFSLFKYIILIIGSPLFAYLSEKTQVILENKEKEINWNDLRKDIWRDIKLAGRNVLWQTFFFAILLLLTLVPIAGWITPLIALFLECYYYGFSMFDYSFARQNIPLRESIDFAGKHNGLLIGNGLIFYLMHVVAGIGWVLAPAYAVIAANISLYKVKTN